ncbi:hypothetical protein IW152_002016 [Coemansia sp. BCRC 34962]|nr:hypothetical protein IW152_002016 [Coemansia sp. BCRC 34962]
MQQSKPLVRFLVWAQFAMPLWFVFLNATIATDLLLSQLLRLNVARLQAIHRWYLPVASLTAFTLALPLLIYHSAYQPSANVFSVQFPSALSVTLYYILAFDLWIAIGIIYCFVVVSLVVSVIVIKLRKKRAAWDIRNMAQVECGWASQPIQENKDDEAHAEIGDQPIATTAVASEAETTPVFGDGGEVADKRRRSCDSASSINSVRYSESHRLQTFIAIKVPENFASRQPSVAVPPGNTGDPGDTLVSGITLESSEIAAHNIESLKVNEGMLANPKSVLFATSFSNNSCSLKSSSSFQASEISAIDVAQLGASPEDPANSRHDVFATSAPTASSPEIAQAPHSTSSTANETHGGIVEESPALSPFQAKSGPVRAPRPLISLNSLPPQFTLRSSNQSTFASQTYSTPFRIPTLALVRLLLYPLIPIFSFTLMCVVRWVWFRSAMPSRWEILNVVSGFLRAMEGLLCLMVFLLNPALNRSFREIRKRNTPVFT